MEAGRLHKWLGSLLAATLVTTPLSGQTDWVDRSTNPAAVNAHALAFDLLRGRTVLFGGVMGTGTATFLADTWEYDATAWTRRAPATMPPARAGHALAFDLARGRAVLFGGGNVTGALADTWEWDGTNWTQRFPAQSPPARSGHALASDIIRNRTVLFGATANADTWEWDGVNWLQCSPASSPPARAGLALSFDLLRGRTVLFGGLSNGLPAFGDTWEWDGTIWLQLTPAQSPPGRFYHTL